MMRLIQALTIVILILALAGVSAISRGDAPPGNRAGPTSQQAIEWLHQQLGDSSLELSTSATSAAERFSFDYVMEPISAEAKSTTGPRRITILRNKEQVSIICRDTLGLWIGYATNGLLLDLDDDHPGVLTFAQLGCPSFHIYCQDDQLPITDGKYVTAATRPDVSVSLKSVIDGCLAKCTDASCDPDTKIFRCSSAESETSIYVWPKGAGIIPVRRLDIKSKDFHFGFDFSQDNIDDLSSTINSAAEIASMAHRRGVQVTNLPEEAPLFSAENLDLRALGAGYTLEAMVIGGSPIHDGAGDQATHPSDCDVKATKVEKQFLDRLAAAGPMILSSGRDSAADQFLFAMSINAFKPDGKTHKNSMLFVRRFKGHNMVFAQDLNRQLCSLIVDGMFVGLDYKNPGGLVMLRGQGAHFTIAPKPGSLDPNISLSMTSDQNALDSRIELGGWIRSNARDISAIAYDPNDDCQTLVAAQNVWNLHWVDSKEGNPLPLRTTAAYNGAEGYYAIVGNMPYDFSIVTPGQVLALGVPVREITEWDPSTPLLPEREIEPNSPLGLAASKLSSLLNNPIATTRSGSN